MQVMQESVGNDPKNRYLGKVIDTDHPLSGMLVELTTRHAPPTEWGYTLVASENPAWAGLGSSPLDECLVVGFASIEL